MFTAKESIKSEFNLVKKMARSKRFDLILLFVGISKHVVEFDWNHDFKLKYFLGGGATSIRDSVCLSDVQCLFPKKIGFETKN